MVAMRINDRTFEVEAEVFLVLPAEVTFGFVHALAAGSDEDYYSLVTVAAFAFVTEKNRTSPPPFDN